MSGNGNTEDIAGIYRSSKDSLDLACAAYERTVRSVIPPGVSDVVVSSRVKDIRSLVVKARGAGGSGRPWASIMDKVGVRVVASTKSDVRAIDASVQAGPWTVEERDLKSGRPEQLYYSGTHFLVDSGLFTDRAGGPIVAEIQIRTRAQDAWSVVSHKLLYKGLVDPPDRMRRVIARLTVLMEMFDDEVHRMFIKRRKLPAYRPARFLEHLELLYESLVGDYAMPPVDLVLPTMLLALYGDADVDEVAARIGHFVDTNRARLEALLAERSPKRENYLDSRDWLFNLPEILAVLERGDAAAYSLVDAFRDTDYESIVSRSCAAYGVFLPE